MTTSSNELPGPFSHPAAWRGEELFSRSDWLHELTEKEIQELSDTSSSLPTLGGRLAAIQHDLEHGSGACMIRRLPVENYAEAEARRVFAALTSNIGTAVSQSAKGETVFSVRDEGYKIGQPQARGPNTRKRLSFHTDRCDVIAFLCLKQARSGGENQIVSSMTVYNEIRKRRPDLAAILLQPFYYQRHNVDTGNDRPWCRQPIFSECEGRFAGSYLRVLIDRAYASPEIPDMTPQEREALDFIEEVASEPDLHVTFRQEPGDILLLNNWVTLHRREEFEDHEDPEQRRHLLRIWLSVPNSRPLVPDFKANFGSTKAGAIRGGMRPQG